MEPYILKGEIVMMDLVILVFAVLIAQAVAVVIAITAFHYAFTRTKTKGMDKITGWVDEGKES